MRFCAAIRWRAAVLVASFFLGSAAAAAQVVINEIDYDQPGSDDAEFVELLNKGAASVNLGTYTLKLIDAAAGPGEYAPSPIALPAVDLAPGDYFVISESASTVANTDFVVIFPGADGIQNGSPDAVQLLDGMTVVDTVSYEGTTSGFTEGTGASAADDDVTPNIGLSRFPDGADTDDNNADVSLRCITPGGPNSMATGMCPTPLIVRATKIDSLTSVLGVSGDVDADGVADPGETISYTVEIEALGADAPGVVFDDVVGANTTLAPASVRVTPIAFDDDYDTDSGTQLVVPVGTGVLTNDIDPDHSTAPGTNTDLTAVSLDVTGTLGTVADFMPDGSFKYDPPATFTSPDSFQYTARDEDALDSVVTGVVVISPTNTAPTAVDDSYKTLGNTLLEVALAAPSGAPAVTGEDPGPPAVYAGVLDNDTDPETTVGFTAAVVAATVTPGAVVAMNADGSFSYLPPVGFTGTDTFDYEVTDDGSLTDTGTVSINVSQMIWFVDNTNAGAADGRSATPYTSLSPIDAGGADDGKDGTGDTIFVFKGTGNTSGGILLEANQILHGHAVALDPAAFNYAGGAALVPASTRPSITDAAGDVIVLANGNTVRGLDIAATAGRAVFGNAVAGATFDKVGTTGTGTGTGMRFDNATGTIAVSDVDIDSSTGPGIDIQGGSATFTFDAASSITNPDGTAFNVNGGTASVTYPGSLTQIKAFPAVNIVNHATGTIGFGGTIISTGGTAGTGLQFSNADGTYNVTSMSGTTTLNGGDAGIDILSGSSGTFTFSNISITNPSGVGFNVDTSTGGNVTYNGTISKSNAASAVRINAKTGGNVTFSGAITANTSTATGIDLTSNTGGTFSFNGGLNIDTTSGTGFNATGGGTVNVTATAGDESISTTSGKALNLDSMTAGITFDSVTATGLNGNEGIDLSGVSGSLTVNGGTLTNLGAGDAIQIGSATNLSGGNAVTNIAANINSTGATGQALDIRELTGGSLNFGGQLTDNAATGGGILVSNINNGTIAYVSFTNATKKMISTSSATAVDLTGNTNGSISFTGGALDIDTTSGLGFNATGGAVAINVTGTGNTVTSTTGTAVNIDSTTIGASGVTFQSVSANGALSGIVLNSTGTLGGLTITGDGGGAKNASGGTIQNTIEDGIRLSNTRDVSISQLNITDAAQQADGTAGDDHAIDISAVTNFTYQDAVIDGFGNSVSHHDDQHSIAILNLFGTSLIEDVRFDNINEDGIEYINNTTDDGSRDVLTVRRGDFNDHLATNGESSIQAESQLTSNMGLTVDDCDFDVNGNGALGVLANSTGTSNFSITIQGSTFNAASAFGAGTIQIVNASDSTGTNVITGNDINDTPFNGILVNNDDNATSTATISNNTIDGSGVGVNNGFGIQVRQDENGSMTVLIDNNGIRDMDANQIRVQARDTTDGSGIINATVTDNMALNAPGDFIYGFELLKQDNNTACLDIRGNNFIGNDGGFPGFGDDIRLSQSGTAAMNVEQTSAANITALNNSDSVSVGGTANFSAANCPTP